MASLNMSTAAMTVALLFLTTAVSMSEAQGIATCAQSLVPCYSSLNTTTTPPSTCCDPIKQAVATQLTCLCNLYNTPGLLSNFNVSVDQALNLTRRCGVSTDLSACTKAEAPTAPPPPGVPGNDGSRMAWTGISSLLLLVAVSLFY